MRKTYEIIDIAKRFLPEEEFIVVKDFYENGEFGIAVAQTVDRLHDLSINIDIDTADRIKCICYYMKLDENEWGFIYDLVKKQNVASNPRQQGANPLDTYENMIAGDLSVEECVKALQENGVSELIAVRILRKKYDMSFEDAVAQINKTRV